MDSSQTTSVPIDSKIEKSLEYSILDGFFYSVKVGVGTSFFAPFAIFLGANNVQLGLLGTFPQIIGAVVQLFSQKLLSLFHSRKHFVCFGAFLQAMMLIPIILAFFLGAWKVHYLLLFISLFWTFGMMFGPVWNSWMGDLVPEHMRGNYFGKRNKIVGLASFLAMLLGGFVLHIFNSSHQATYLGFCILFGIAFIARILSFVFLSKKYEPEYVIGSDTKIGFKNFFKQVKNSDYGNFLYFMGAMNLAVFFSAPFFSPYMLKDLEMDYLTFTIVNSAPIITRFFVMTPWGQACDRFGNKKVLSLTGFLMPIVPMMWIFSEQIWYLIVIQVYSGIVWAGFEIASFNYTFEIIERKKRITYLAYYNFVLGITIFLGGLIGGLFIRYNPFSGSKYLAVFFASGLLRLMISFIFLPRLKEARNVENISYRELLWKVIATLPTVGFVQQALFFQKKDRPNQQKLATDLSKNE